MKNPPIGTPVKKSGKNQTDADDVGVVGEEDHMEKKNFFRAKYNKYQRKRKEIPRTRVRQVEVVVLY